MKRKFHWNTWNRTEENQGYKSFKSFSLFGWSIVSVNAAGCCCCCSNWNLNRKMYDIYIRLSDQAHSLAFMCINIYLICIPCYTLHYARKSSFTHVLNVFNVNHEHLRLRSDRLLTTTRLLLTIRFILYYYFFLFFFFWFCIFRFVFGLLWNGCDIKCNIWTAYERLSF